MSNPDRAAPSHEHHNENVALPSERDRELLDYLIERAWQNLLRSLPQNPTNENHDNKHAA